MTAAVVIPAAGSGTRMGGAVAKQYVVLDGRPVLAHTLAAFAGLVEQAVLAISPHAEADAAAAIAASEVSFPVTVVHGGATRQDSVHAGLRATDPAHQSILVHDAARPLIDPTIIRNCCAALETHPAVVTAVPCAATVKRANDQQQVAETVPRHDLWLAQTPQGFQRELGLAAFEQAAHGAATPCTDDAQVLERAGHPVHIVQGSAENLKLTTPDDVALALAIMSARHSR